ncbi:nucleoside-diphosphate sugar epimerase/dehydratase [Aliarcobacter skirrowii]|uniref:nucleoside-diphosphate sugar epimerase/dehydratase n=1 Tax=Aliarcobacter skirrowii TaxID=28200 RepID=UPI0029A72F38|nr:LicD family protein [Aliarcobacter skirrowii]MDX4035818.1 LicD family protein [Aliarcobacter skirrowii]
MKNIVLFGSGNGAKEYLLKIKNCNILAIFDNDIKKHGTSFEGIKIYSPSKINSFYFDEIVIVSQWAKEIYEQLINELKVDKDKIVIPAKKEIKKANRPFEDKQTRELGREIIKEFSKLAIKDNIVLYLDFGTLLGIVRDKDIIEWDDDIDFSVSNISKDVLDDWLKNIIKRVNLPVIINIEDNKFGYIITFINEKKEYNFFQISISFRENSGENSLHLPSKGMWYSPKIHFEKYDIIKYQGQDVFVPYDYENYLTFLYGNWRIPKKDITMADYANLGKVEINKFI